MATWYCSSSGKPALAATSEAFCSAWLTLSKVDSSVYETRFVMGRFTKVLFCLDGLGVRVSRAKPVVCLCGQGVVKPGFFFLSFAWPGKAPFLQQESLLCIS